MDEPTLLHEDGQAAARSLAAPTELGEDAPSVAGYVLARRLGAGSFGEVWEAVQTRTGQSVALKLFTRSDNMNLGNLRHEVARLRQVAEHPHVITLLDADMLHDPPFFAMTLLSGSLAGQALPQERAALDRVVVWLGQVAQALVFTHNKGLLHCDLKPSNLLLDQQGRVRVADFGQAVAQGHSRGSLGSVGTMAPEQAEGGLPDVSWDIYGLGATAYRLLSGRWPRLRPGPSEPASDALEAYLRELRSSELVPLRQLNPLVDADLAAIVESCLALEPGQRTPSAAQFAEDLQRRRARRPLLCQRPWRAAYLAKRFLRRHAALTAAALCAGASLVGLLLTRAHDAAVERHLLAQREVNYGWTLQQQGFDGEALLWWARAQRLEPDCPVARLALSHYPAPLASMLEHGRYLSAVEFSPDGHSLVSASVNSVKVWDLSTNQVRTEWKDEGALPRSDVFHFQQPLAAYTRKGLFAAPGRRLLLEGTELATNVDVLALRDGGALLSTPQGLVLRRGQRLTALAPAPPVAAPPSGAWPGEGFSWWPESLTLVVGAPTQSVCAALSPGCKRVALFQSGRLLLWDGGNGRLLGQQELPDDMNALSFSPDGQRLASSGATPGRPDRAPGGALRLFEGPSLQPRAVWNDVSWPVYSATFAPDGERLVTCSFDGSVRALSVPELQPVGDAKKHRWNAYEVRFSPSGKRVASYAIDGTVRVWDWPGFRPLTPFLEHRMPVKSAAFSPDDRHLATACLDGTVRLFALGGEGRRRVAHGSRRELTCLSGDRQCLLGLGCDGRASLLDTASGHELGPSVVLGLTTQMCLSADASLAAALGYDQQLRIWDVATGRFLGSPRLHPRKVVWLCLAPDHKVATVCQDDKLRLWSGDKDAPEVTLELGMTPTWAGYSPDGSLLAVAGHDGSTAVFKTPLSKDSQPRRWQHGKSAISRACFSPDGRWLATGSLSGSVSVFDAETGVEKWHLAHQHTLPMWDLVFSPDGKRLGTSSSDATAITWDMTTGKPLTAPMRHDGPLLKVAFSPDGRWLATASKDRLARVWDAVSGQMVVAPVIHGDMVCAVDFTPDGHLLSVSRDGQVIDSDLSVRSGPVDEKAVSRVTGLRLEGSAAVVLSSSEWQAISR